MFRHGVLRNWDEAVRFQPFFRGCRHGIEALRQRYLLTQTLLVQSLLSSPWHVRYDFPAG
jgi:hypothetical protein